ncbi:unnamed protein product [Calypogeia fissa]
MEKVRNRGGLKVLSEQANGKEETVGAGEKGKGPTPEQLRRRSLICMLLLALQYGAQPLLSQYFSGKRVIMTTVVLACELVKIVCALLAMVWLGQLGTLRSDWSFADALKGSALPAVIYAVQNTLVQMAYRNLDSLTASLLNQTKLVFTGLFMFVFLGYKQSKHQVGALLLLLIAATLLSLSKKSASEVQENSFFLGVVPILVASMLSGLASTLCQWSVQVKKRSTYLMTLEMSAIGSFVLIASMLQSPDGVAIREKGFLHGWTPLTIIPVFTNAVGGILVGLVTMYAGGVKKGFVVVSALLVTAALQVLIDRAPPPWHVIAALPLVVSSSIIHQKYPYTAKKEKEEKKAA